MKKKNYYLNILELVFVLFTGHCIVYANIIINLFSNFLKLKKDTSNSNLKDKKFKKILK